MMFLDESQRGYLKGKAGFLLSKLKEYEKQKEEWRLDIAVGNLLEACEMGYEVAMHEVHSTPWEWQYTCLNVQSLNEMSAKGWEMVNVVSAGEAPVFIWRRRKAVSDGETDNAS